MQNENHMTRDQYDREREEVLKRERQLYNDQNSGDTMSSQKKSNE